MCKLKFAFDTMKLNKSNFDEVWINDIKNFKKLKKAVWHKDDT